MIFRPDPNARRRRGAYDRPPSHRRLLQRQGNLIMNIGSKDLDALRETASKALIALLWLHVPIALAIGMARGADWLLPTLLTVALATAATLSWRAAGNGLSTNLLVAVALMGGD